MLITTNRSRSAALLAAPILAVLLACPAEAQVRKGPKKPREPQQQSDQQLRQALHTLHSVKKTLQGANHDYGGHRVAAIRDVGAAAHQLRLALHSRKRPGGKPSTGPRQPEPQALSDAQLAASIPVLRNAITLLQNANHDYGGHRAKAVTDLHKAIKQLEKALAFSQKNDRNKP
jgi:hypothetical protein